MTAVQMYEMRGEESTSSGVKRLWNSRMRAASAEPRAASICSVSVTASSRTPSRGAAPSLSSISGLTVSTPSREASQYRSDSPSSEATVGGLIDSPRPREPILIVTKRSHTSHHRAGSPTPQLPPSPLLLPPRKPHMNLTVVFDLDETLVSNRHSAEAIPRPYYHAVLEGLRKKKDVELVLWTASTRDVTEKVISSLQDGDVCYFDHIICRDKQWFTEPTHTKNLRLLGRRLDTVVIVENSANCCKLNPQNAILVADYHGNDEDASLVNVYYMIEAVIHLLESGYSVSTALRTLAKEQLLCEWHDMELPEVWKRAPIWKIAPHKIPAYGKFVKSKTTYDAA